MFIFSIYPRFSEYCHLAICINAKGQKRRRVQPLVYVSNNFDGRVFYFTINVKVAMI